MQDGHEDRRVDEPGLPSETRQHLGSWLRALAGLCLAAAVAGGAVIAAGGSTAGADAQSFVPAPSEPCTLPSIGVAVRATAQMFQLQAFPDDKQVRLTWQKPASGEAFAIYDWPAQDSSQVARVDTASGAVHGEALDQRHQVLLRDRPRQAPVRSVEHSVGHPGDGAGGARRADRHPGQRPGDPVLGRARIGWRLAVTGYNLYVGTTADFRDAPVTKVTGTAVTVTGLANGTTYYFRVTAVNRVGEGPASNEVRPSR